MTSTLLPLGRSLVLASLAAAALASGAHAQGLMLDPISRVPSLVIVPLAELPAAPEGATDNDSCAHFLVTPTSEGGLLAQSLGWGITGEVALPGGLQAVSFIGGTETGTSGSCLLADGNVGFFEGETLIAVAYGAGSYAPIGHIEPFGENGARIWNGDFLQQPIADVELLGPILSISPLADAEPFCEGAAVVPNVYGVPIEEARVTLQENGWTSVEGGAVDGDIRAGDFVAAGIVEVQGCSGTGFGYCGFSYTGAGGAVLDVTTVGEGDGESGPEVSGYGVSCEGAL